MLNLDNIKDKIIYYDFEVFKDDWLVVFQNSTGQQCVIVNDRDCLEEFINLNSDMIMVGYNNKAFDSYIIKSILIGLNPRGISDYIVAGGQGWEYPEFEGKFVTVPPQIDLMQDTLGLGLKTIEGNIGWNIKETDVDFNIDRKLTDEEIELTIDYCKADVQILPELFKLRKDYLSAKCTLCDMAGIPLEKGLSLTNAKLTAMFLGAKATNVPERRSFNYKNIPNVKWDKIPEEVKEYFNLILDSAVSDDDFDNASLNINLLGVPHTIGKGGIHGAVKNYFSEADDNMSILNYDVGSLYPSIILNNNYVSRCVPDSELYRKVYTDRLAAKKEKNKPLANALKLVLNTFYGAMNNQYNELYDPSMALATCVTGQILLIELIICLGDEVSLEFIQSNTDGIMFKVAKSDRPRVLEIISEWEQRHHLGMEEDVIIKVAQRDVNNYCMMFADGKIKCKGGELSDYNPDGEVRWKHNSLSICCEAMINYFMLNKDPRDTIEQCKDLSKFQMITKVGRTYDYAVRYEYGEYKPIQRINRVFAGKNICKGIIYKVKQSGEQISYNQLPNCPERTLIDGYDNVTIDDVDKEWYVNLVEKRIKKFKGEK